MAVCKVLFISTRQVIAFYPFRTKKGNDETLSLSGLSSVLLKISTNQISEFHIIYENQDTKKS